MRRLILILGMLVVGQGCHDAGRSPDSTTAVAALDVKTGPSPQAIHDAAEELASRFKANVGDDGEVDDPEAILDRVLTAHHVADARQKVLDETKNVLLGQLGRAQSHYSDVRQKYGER